MATFQIYMFRLLGRLIFPHKLMPISKRHICVQGRKDRPWPYLGKPGTNTVRPVGQSYKASTIINYDSRVVKWGIFKPGSTLES